MVDKEKNYKTDDISEFEYRIIGMTPSQEELEEHTKNLNYICKNRKEVQKLWTHCRWLRIPYFCVKIKRNRAVLEYDMWHAGLDLNDEATEELKNIFKDVLLKSKFVPWMFYTAGPVHGEADRIELKFLDEVVPKIKSIVYNEDNWEIPKFLRRKQQPVELLF